MHTDTSTAHADTRSSGMVAVQPEPGAEATPLRARFAALRDALQADVIGQQALVERLLIALLADGHLLVEGAPGLAKTTAIKALAARIEADFHRVQFTPDLLPADLTGTDVLRPATGLFEFEQGPLFHNLVLADEINRAPAKVQSALLEAMAERQVTIGRRSWPLPKLFLVMATQNPIEQEGTFPLPEALRDKIAWGASPRASIALERCARAAAWLAGRDYVLPEDVQTLAPDVLRHRVLLGYEAEAEGLRVDDVVRQLLERVPLP